MSKTNDKKYKYVEVVYEDDFSETPYSYKTTIDEINIGDIVLVDRNGNETTAVVQSIDYYSKDNAPYPVDKTKDIIEIVGHDDEFDDYNYEYQADDTDEMVSDYNKILLNSMFGRLAITRLMKLNSPKNGEEDMKLFYYQKFNIFYYKDNENNYKLAEYSTNVITNDMFRIIDRDSIEVPQKGYARTNDSESFCRAVEFCKKNNIPYFNDTDVLEFTEEKEKLDMYQKYEEPKGFKSIEEIKEYLKNDYKEAYWKTPTPDYYIDDDHIVYYFGWLEYDMRVFIVRHFMEKNNYIVPKYYSDKFLKEHPELKDMCIDEYDIEKLDIGKLSYLFERIYNIERIAEGTVNRAVMDGFLLRIVTRAEQLKNGEK